MRGPRCARSKRGKRLADETMPSWISLTFHDVRKSSLRCFLSRRQVCTLAEIDGINIQMTACEEIATLIQKKSVAGKHNKDKRRYTYLQRHVLFCYVHTPC